MSPSTAPIRKHARQPQSGGSDRRVEQHERAAAPMRRAHPERAVDGEIRPAAHARRDEFRDGRIDRGILAADARAGAGSETARSVARFHEKAVAAVAATYRASVMKKSLRRPSRSVSQPKTERTEHRAGDVRAAGKPTSALVKLQRRALLSARSRPRPRASPPDRRATHVMPSASTISV